MLFLLMMVDARSKEGAEGDAVSSEPAELTSSLCLLRSGVILDLFPPLRLFFSFVASLASLS